MTTSTIPFLHIQPLVRLMKALADPTRLRIVALLSHGELCVCHVESGLELAQPTASRHLSILRNAGVLDSRRDGSWIYYSLATQTNPAAGRLLSTLVAEFAQQDVLAQDVARLRRSKGPSSIG